MAASHSYQLKHNICVDPNSEAPAEAYKCRGPWNQVKKCTPVHPNSPIRDDMLRVVCISDTHSFLDRMTIPDGDILIHAGDFTMRGGMREVETFNKIISGFPHRNKIVIAGNHEVIFGAVDGHCGMGCMIDYLNFSTTRELNNELAKYNVRHPRELLSKDIIYLQNSSARVCGLNIWGSPWSPYHQDWAYNARRGQESLAIWDQIPDNTDIVITHTPPLGIGDLTVGNKRAGCVDLFNTITKRVKPRLHVFGHIHEGHGMFSDGTTTYINAATVDHGYKYIQPPICVDLPLPAGYDKRGRWVEEITARHIHPPK